MVDEANVIIQKSNEISVKYRKMFNDLLGDNLTKVRDLDAYKEENKSKFDEVISFGDQLMKLYDESAGKFEQASKMDVPEKFSEYLAIKGQEMKKRSETEKLTGPISQRKSPLISRTQRCSVTGFGPTHCFSAFELFLDS